LRRKPPPLASGGVNPEGSAVPPSFLPELSAQPTLLEGAFLKPLAMPEEFHFCKLTVVSYLLPLTEVSSTMSSRRGARIFQSNREAASSSSARCSAGGRDTK